MCICLILVCEIICRICSIIKFIHNWCVPGDAMHRLWNFKTQSIREETHVITQYFSCDQRLSLSVCPYDHLWGGELFYLSFITFSTVNHNIIETFKILCFNPILNDVTMSSVKRIHSGSLFTHGCEMLTPTNPKTHHLPSAGSRIQYKFRYFIPCYKILGNCSYPARKW